MPILSTSKLVQPRLFTNETDRIPSAEMPSSSAAATQHMLKEQYYVPVQQQQRRRKISFNETVRVRSAIHVDDMTDEEFFNTWYSQREMSNIKKSMTRDLKLWLVAQQAEKKRRKQQQMEEEKQEVLLKTKSNVSFSKEKKEASNIKELLTNHYASNYNIKELFTIRGVEYRTKKGSEIRRRNKFTSINAVINEQELQGLCGSIDAEAIRTVYLLHGGTQCAVEAHKLGAKDAWEAQQIHNEDKEVEDKGAAVTTQNDNDATLSSSLSVVTSNSKLDDDGALSNQLYIQTFHRKRKVVKELKSLVKQLE